jgi:hypothetical protein
MLKWSLAAIAAIVVVFLIVVAMQPSDFKVERSATMRAPAPAAFAQVNDFPEMAGVVAVGEGRPRAQAPVRGPAGRHRRGLCLAGQQGRRRRPA